MRRRYRYRHPREIERAQELGLAEVPKFTRGTTPRPTDCRDCGLRFDANVGPVGAQRALCSGCRAVLEDEARRLGHPLRWWIDDERLSAWVHEQRQGVAA